MKKETIEARRLAGLCIRCGVKVVEGRSLCQYHLDKSKTKSEKRREKLRNNNSCLRCGKPARDGMKSCEFCGKKAAQYSNKYNKSLYTERQESNICVRCGGSKETDSVHCNECQKYMKSKDKKKYDELKILNLCTHCGSEKDIDGTLCSVCKDINSKNGYKSRRSQKERVINHYGGKCFCCGETKIKFLTIDHINNDGYKHRKDINKEICRWIINNNFPENMFQVACYNCNCGRAKNNGICPHQEQKLEPNV